MKQMRMESRLKLKEYPMSQVGKPERTMQNCVIALFREDLG